MSEIKNRVFVYISAIFDCDSPEILFPPERQKELESITNKGVRLEKYCAWKLLERAISDITDRKISEFEFTKNSQGKWCAEGIEFSISHSNGVVAVAVSDTPVGVDVQHIGEPKNSGFAKRVLTNGEFEAYSALPASKRSEYVYDLWARKESIFKFDNSLEFFCPASIDASAYKTQTQKITVDGNEYFFAVTAESFEEVIKVFV